MLGFNHANIDLNHLIILGISKLHVTSNVNGYCVLSYQQSTSKLRSPVSRISSPPQNVFKTKSLIFEGFLLILHLKVSVSLTLLRADDVSISVAQSPTHSPYVYSRLRYTCTLLDWVTKLLKSSKS